VAASFYVHQLSAFHADEEILRTCFGEFYLLFIHRFSGQCIVHLINLWWLSVAHLPMLSIFVVHTCASLSQNICSCIHRFYLVSGAFCYHIAKQARMCLSIPVLNHLYCFCSICGKVVHLSAHLGLKGLDLSWQ